jgi:predicted metal-dependent enzyme (double-stranded beta helix superfamily)
MARAQVVQLSRPARRELTEQEQELTVDEQERFEGLCQCIADSEDSDEDDSQVWCQVAIVNGQRRVVVWVATGDPEPNGDQPCEPLAILLSDADEIAAEGVEHVGEEAAT